MKTNCRFTVIAAAMLLVCITAANSFSQSQISSADIKGIVTDATGAVLPGASVTVTNIETGVERSLVTDSTGNFRFFLVPPAEYELKVQLPSFSTYTRRPLQVTVGETVSFEAILKLASVQLEVLVQEELSQVETEKTQQSDTIT